MRSEKILFSTRVITVKESPRGFQYLERLGKDSIAVLLVRKNGSDASGYEVLIRQQPLCVDNSEVDGNPKLFACPLTGRIETDEQPMQAAMRETLEESGYGVELTSLGSYFVGTQTNEVCYLYYADVTGIEPKVAAQDGTYFESVSHNEWQPLENLNGCDYVACQLGYFRLKAALLV